MKKVKKKVSQSKQFLLNYLDAFIDTDDFQNNIRVLRAKFGIPKKGFKFSKEKRNKLFTENLLIEIFYTMYIAEELKKNEKEIDIINDINKSLFEVVKQFPIYDPGIFFIFKCYLFYNKRMYEVLEKGVNDVDMCKTVDIIQDIDDYLNFYNKRMYEVPEKGANDVDMCKIVDIIQDMNNHLHFYSEMSGYFRKLYEDYPVVIKLHPNITQNDLIDYIKKNWSAIESYLCQYKEDECRLGKVRNRKASIKKRNDFIYKKRNLPREEIRKLVSNKFNESLDGGHIGKIISLENKKRKEV